MPSTSIGAACSPSDMIAPLPNSFSMAARVRFQLPTFACPVRPCPASLDWCDEGSLPGRGSEQKVSSGSQIGRRLMAEPVGEFSVEPIEHPRLFARREPELGDETDHVVGRPLLVSGPGKTGPRDLIADGSSSLSRRNSSDTWASVARPATSSRISESL